MVWRNVVSTEPTFEEGPFFLVKELDLLQRQPGHTTQRLVVWATDGSTAQRVAEQKLGHRFVYDELIGDLQAAKDRVHLTSAQITNLHREGYLRL